MKDDVISRQDAIDAFGDKPEVWTEDDEYAKGCASQWESDILAIKALPSAQLERKKGEWARIFDGNEWYWFCSNCKEEWYEEDLWMGGNDFPKFCPECGADMRGEEECTKAQYTEYAKKS